MKHTIRAFGFACKGFVACFKEERSFRIEIVITVLVFAFGIYLKLSSIEWAILSITAFFVLAVEALNTALEDLCNKVEPNQDPAIGKVKDISAAAVLLAVIGAVLVALFIFIPYF
jgi:diacylglycerol kinase